MKHFRVLFGVLLVLMLGVAAWAQTGSITGTVRDPSGAAIAGATVVVASPERGITREMQTTETGDYNQSGLPQGTYDIIVTATGFKKFQARSVVLDVAQKARVDVTLQVGSASTEVVVEGTAVAQVETQSSELAGTVTGKEITQLELNGRNFGSLVTLVPGVSNQTGLDEGQVGLGSNVLFSMNGGRTEYNNWELDGGDNIDNGSNSLLNVNPSIDAISEFKVLTSNYGAQYGRNGSGTVEVETKSGTRQFHGDAYEFVRNDAFNANNYFNSLYRGGDGTVPAYKKNDWGYTVGGPVYIPGVYNQKKERTFFFWSQEWRRERVPHTFNQQVPSNAERGGDFSDVCPNPQSGSWQDCPTDPRTGAHYDGSQGPLPVDPAAAVLLPLIPNPTTDTPGAAIFNLTTTQPTSWREELVRVDHNLNEHNRVTFRYIHDSWETVDQTTIWTSSTFPTAKTYFKGPGVSMVARVTSTVSPSLLNEFVASYTTDHINFKTQGYWQRPTNFSSVMGGFPSASNYGGKVPAICIDNGAAYGGGGFCEDPDGMMPEGPYNTNPTYTYRDNLTKIVGRHNLQFGAYFVAAQKNELSTLQVNGFLHFNNGSTVTSGNAFADMLLGRISSYSQGSNQLKFYQRYKIFEPYFQDDWRVTDRLTLNLGLRVSLEGTYRERYNNAYNWDPAAYNAANAPFIYDANGVAPANAPADAAETGTPYSLVTDTSGKVIGDPFVGLVHCGSGNVPDSCVQGHLFNPAPRIGFAWDPKGNGKTAIRGGYGMFFEHANGNEANTEGLMEGGQSSPLLSTQSQHNVVGYLNVGTGAVAPQFPIRFMSIPTKLKWPYVQQWHLDIQHELPAHTVATVSYVGSKGTRLGRQRDLNQLQSISAAQNPYHPGQAITDADCSTLTHIGDPNVQGIVNGQAVTGQAAINLQTACNNNADPYRPFYGLTTIQSLENKASSNYNALQVSLRKSVGALNLTAAYTYSHSIDDTSDRYDGGFVDSYNLRRSRASSNFDQRHLLTVAWIYDLPFFKKSGPAHTLLGGWQYSGIETFATGTPVTVYNGTGYGDNAGVGNGVGSHSYADLIGDPGTGIPETSQLAGTNYSKFVYNPGAYALPTGLTFGDSGRNSLRNVHRINFDMALFKHFAIKEKTAFEFRAEAFNVFNHTEWGSYSGTMSCTGGANNSAGDPSCVTPGGANMFEMSSAHLARVLQIGGKFIF